MKTLLIQPDAPTSKYSGIGGYPPIFPLGLGYIAAILEQNHDIKVIDNEIEKLENNSLMKHISKIDPEIVGITSESFRFSRAIEIADMIKQINENIIVVIGGPHSNVWPDYPLKYNCFDVSVYGEGEKTVVELWDKIEKGESFKDVKGIAYKKKDEIIINPRRDPIKNLDELPFPARHLFPMNKYPRKDFDLSVSPVDSINTSRGCPFSCNFCSSKVVFGNKYRSRSPKNTTDEIELLISDYGAKGIYVREDIFTVNKRRVSGICNEIKERGLDFKWACESRVDTINEEMLRSMKNAGCEVIWFGVEKGSQKMLDYLNKRITISQIREAFKLCKKNGIRAGASFMIGIPGETMDDVYQTIDFACKLDPDFAWFNIFNGTPTSPMYEYVVQNKLYSKDIGHGVLLIKTDEFDREKLEGIQRYANKRFRTPKRLFKLLLSEIRRGDLTVNKLLKGIKYYFR